LYKRLPAFFPPAVYGGSIKKTALELEANSWITFNPSSHRKSILSATCFRFRSLFASVSGYQRELIPFPFSPYLRNPDPSARIPPWKVRFLRIVWKAFPLCVLGVFFISRITASLFRSKLRTRLASHSASPLTMDSHTAAISSSNSTITTFCTRFSKRAVRLIIPPPAKGSTRILGFGYA